MYIVAVINFVIHQTESKMMILKDRACLSIILINWLGMLWIAVKNDVEHVFSQTNGEVHQRSYTHRHVEMFCD